MQHLVPALESKGNAIAFKSVLESLVRQMRILPCTPFSPCLTCSWVMEDRSPMAGGGAAGRLGTLKGCLAGLGKPLFDLLWVWNFQISFSKIRTYCAGETSRSRCQPGRSQLIMFIFFKNWSIVALQCCISFCCTMEWISCTCTYIPSFLDFLPI